MHLSSFQYVYLCNQFVVLFCPYKIHIIGHTTGETRSDIYFGHFINIIYTGLCTTTSSIIDHVLLKFHTDLILPEQYKAWLVTNHTETCLHT